MSEDQMARDAAKLTESHVGNSLIEKTLPICAKLAGIKSQMVGYLLQKGISRTIAELAADNAIQVGLQRDTVTVSTQSEYKNAETYLADNGGRTLVDKSAAVCQELLKVQSQMVSFLIENEVSEDMSKLLASLTVRFAMKNIKKGLEASPAL